MGPSGPGLLGTEQRKSGTKLSYPRPQKISRRCRWIVIKIAGETEDERILNFWPISKCRRTGGRLKYECNEEWLGTGVWYKEICVNWNWMLGTSSRGRGWDDDGDGGERRLLLLLYWGFVRDFVIVLDTRLGRYAQEQNLGMGTPRIQMSDRGEGGSDGQKGTESERMYRV